MFATIYPTASLGREFMLQPVCARQCYATLVWQPPLLQLTDGPLSGRGESWTAGRLDHRVKRTGMKSWSAPVGQSQIVRENCWFHRDYNWWSWAAGPCCSTLRLHECVDIHTCTHMRVHTRAHTHTYASQREHSAVAQFRWLSHYRLRKRAVDGGCLSPETLPLARRCLWEKRPETEGSFGDAPGPQGGNLPDQSLGRLTPTVCKRLFSLFAGPSPDSVTDSEQGCSFILSNPGQSLISTDVVYRWIKLEALLRPITRLRPPVVNITQFLFFFLVATPMLTLTQQMD